MAKKTILPVLMLGFILLAVVVVGGYFLATWLETSYAVPITLTVFIVLAIGIFSVSTVPLFHAFKR